MFFWEFIEWKAGAGAGVGAGVPLPSPHAVGPNATSPDSGTRRCARRQNFISSSPARRPTTLARCRRVHARAIRHQKWRFGNCFGPENDGCEMDAATANWLQGRLIRPNQDYTRYQRIL